MYKWISLNSTTYFLYQGFRQMWRGSRVKLWNWSSTLNITTRSRSSRRCCRRATGAGAEGSGAWSRGKGGSRSSHRCCRRATGFGGLWSWAVEGAGAAAAGGQCSGPACVAVLTWHFYELFFCCIILRGEGHVSDGEWWCGCVFPERWDWTETRWSSRRKEMRHSHGTGKWQAKQDHSLEPYGPSVAGHRYWHRGINVDKAGCRAYKCSGVGFTRRCPLWASTWSVAVLWSKQTGLPPAWGLSVGRPVWRKWPCFRPFLVMPQMCLSHCWPGE